MVGTQAATGVDCKSIGSVFAGSSPARPTTERTKRLR